ncbi:flagellar biosynthesis repressor FlbT [Novosphingobium sp. Rr 2-17]|uniref:flagellar biosynthesis repressor FlbT n=1 Tax=Novosphingobium sp. Rr 2-17 TaxID=555793 RepID=UPI000269954F|nr:flagellar biosynthesis repressor FlbT [Novosphingobium sp. Rr 2-17]EIZ78746.1 flagellar biosynthesis repressor FlbT [Novosphingobium sp. Rr 2-17]
MSLRISLRDGEPMIINGALLRSVGRTDLSIENSVTVLRGREVMAPEEATTPARRLYYACMLAYIDPAGAAVHHPEIIDYVSALIDALESHEAKAVCAAFARKVACGDFYRALADCRTLITYEAVALGRTECDAA